MNLTQPSQDLDHAAAEAAAGGYGALYEQLHATVQQLVINALSRARQNADLPVPAPRVPPRQRAAELAALSGREHEVLQLVARGDSNKMIARTLGLSPHTVKRHVANILNKIDARSRGQAAAWWLTQS